MDRKTYMRDVYSNYWVTAREEKYGFMDYDKTLCSMVLENAQPGQKVLEVAIGTGEPIAHYLSSQGLDIHGIDISPQLVEKCLNINPKINAAVCDAENLRYQNNEFALTYCFHSTWYFPDLEKALKEMIRVTAPDGKIVFDILNRNNPAIFKDYQRRILKGTLPFRVLRLLKNVLKVIFRVGTPNWHYTVFDVPTSPDLIYKIVAEEKVQACETIKYCDETFEKAKTHDGFTDSPKIIFALTK